MALKVKFYRKFSDLPPRLADQILNQYTWKKGRLREFLRRYDSACTVALIGNRFVGIAAVHYLGRKKKRLNGPDVHVYVRPNYRRRGIGTISLMRLMKRLDLLNGKTIWIAPYNKVGKKFFKACDFSM